MGKVNRSHSFQGFGVVGDFFFFTHVVVAIYCCFSLSFTSAKEKFPQINVRDPQNKNIGH